MNSSQMLQQACRFLLATSSTVTHIKFTPFAARKRRGCVRDASERDLSVHLETALRGVIIGERWPKSGLEIIITVLEGEEDSFWNREGDSNGEGCSRTGGWGMMSMLELHGNARNLMEMHRFSRWKLMESHGIWGNIRSQ